MSDGTEALWLTDPKAYLTKLEKLLGDRDPVEVLAATADVLAGIVNEHSADTLRCRPFKGKWTPNEVLGHLADVEWVYGVRIRLILCQDGPTIRGFDQERWVERQKHNDREPSELLDMFRILRGYNLTVWKGMSNADLDRVGQHNERGPETLGRMLRMHSGHDLSHIDQIERYLAAIKNG